MNRISDQAKGQQRISFVSVGEDLLVELPEY